MRILGFLGLIPLALLNVFGFVMAIRDWNWKGMALMLFMAVLLILFARTLWRGARLERGMAQGRVAEGWEGEPLGAFFRSVVARTTEGRIYLAGAIASELMALASFLWPSFVRIPPDRSHITAMLFALWPILAFVFYIRVCGPFYRSSIFTIVLTSMAVALPFYLTYAR